MNANHARRIFKFFICLLITLIHIPTLADSGKVIWSEPHVALDVQQGKKLIQPLNFSVTHSIRSIRIEVVPSISDVVSVTPQQFEALQPGVIYTTQLVITPSTETQVGVRAGTIHVRDGNATVPAPLKVKINIKEATSDDDYASPGHVSLTGVAVDHFNAISDTVGFFLSGANYSSNQNDIQVYHQGWPVSDLDVTLNSNLLTVVPHLVPGRNEFILVANDTDGKLIYGEFVLWAGNHTLRGYVVDENHQLVPDATVVIKLGDNQTVIDRTTTVSGQFSFNNLPARTVILEVVATNLRVGSVAANGGQGFVYLHTRGFYSPSPIANNDFSQGLSGWETGTAPVWLVPHEEEYQMQSQLPLMFDPETYPISSSDTGVTTPPSSIKINRSDLHNLLNEKLELVPLAISPETTVSMIPPDTDLVLATSGEGPQTISRTFNTAQGTRNVAIRYRFITTEIPGGYFGTQYNDYFNISIRSNSGGSISESNSMNGLGFGAFDSAGRTTWREHSLAVNSIDSSGTARQERLLTVNPEGDTVQIDLTVANVTDGFLDSFLVVAFVEERSLAITAMRLNDIDNTPLNYLSASPHPYFNGNTRIHGTTTIEGATDDALESLALEIIQDGQVVATATLDSDAESTLLQAFGEDQRISISTSQLLFNLVPQDTINASNNGTLSLRARAHSQQGEEATFDLSAVQVLRRFLGANRYGSRDEAEGGDDWAKPSVATFVDTWADIDWGDFSNMNAGRFSPHSSHNTGNDTDGWFDGYNALNANTATTIVGHLNQSDRRITTVFVTYQARNGNAFYDAIRGVTLDDGRVATAVIRPVAGHTTHFHWRITDE